MANRLSNFEYLEHVIPFWDVLRLEQKSEFSRSIFKSKLSKGEILYSGGNDCFGVFVVIKGLLRVFMHSPQGRELTVFRIKSEEMCALAASCVLSSITIPISIEAQEDSEILTIERDFFSRLIDENIYVENFMYKIAMEKFSDLMCCVEQLMFDSVEKRLVNFLLRESENLQIKITHEEIARHIGSVREVVSRNLKMFAKQGYIASKRGRIEISNREGLEILLENL